MIKTADEFQKVFEEIKLDPQNQEYTERGLNLYITLILRLKY